MAKLHQIIAVTNGLKSRTKAAITELHHKLKKDDLLAGLSRKYRPKDDDGDVLPDESKRVQVTVAESLREAERHWTNLLNCVGAVDNANCSARADIVVDDVIVAEEVPVTHLLFLEKQLLDVHTFFSKLPTLDPAGEWERSDTPGCWVTKPVETVKTKKVPRNHVLAEATDKHPAQVQVFNEDVTAGYWTTRAFSGAIQEKSRQELLDRVTKLQDAVKMARERANDHEVVDVNYGDAVCNYLFSLQQVKRQA